MGQIQNSINQLAGSTIGLALGASHSPYFKLQNAKNIFHQKVKAYAETEKTHGNTDEATVASMDEAYHAGQTYQGLARSPKEFERIGKELNLEGFDSANYAKGKADIKRELEAKAEEEKKTEKAEAEREKAEEKTNLARGVYQTALDEYGSLQTGELEGVIPKDSEYTQIAKEEAYKAGRAYLGTASSREQYDAISKELSDAGLDPLMFRVSSWERDQRISLKKAEEQRRQVEASALQRKQEAETAERKRLLTPNTNYGSKAIREFETREADKWQGITQK